jgi:hypothetical protein
MTPRDALDWARGLVLGGTELPPWPPGVARARCRCGAPWFECSCIATLDRGEATPDGYMVVNRPRPRA